jgi:hypothetical protein
VTGEEKSLSRAKVSASGEFEERILSSRADHFAGAKWKEKASACFVRNDGFVVR